MEKIKKKDFIKKFEDEIRETAEEEIVENRKDYFDGYTKITDDDIEGVIETNYDIFIDILAEKKNIKII